MPAEPTSSPEFRHTRRGFLGDAAAAGIALCHGATRATGPDKPMLALPVTGQASQSLASLDELVKSFVEEQRVPGAALAITQGKRLVYARGFGYADRDKKIPVEPDALFRIASISKPFTAVAILQLVERSKLRLTDKVAELIPIKPFLENSAQVDRRLKGVTILHLLQHTGGWDRDKSFDPLFSPIRIAQALKVPLPPKQEDIIRYMFGRPLDFDPGIQYAYSNFGYCLLGEVIRRVTKQSYEDHVRQAILQPLGIKQMRLGRTQEQAPREVRYYENEDGMGPSHVGGAEKQLPFPYGGRFCLEVIDAAGGWIASAVDLMRFAVAFLDPRRCPILKPASIGTMFARPAGKPGLQDNGKPKEVYYGCGWQVRVLDAGRGRANAWHTGRLGSSLATELVNRADGVNWAVLFNTQNGVNGKELIEQIEEPIMQTLDRISVWPNVDLFGQYA